MKFIYAILLFSSIACLPSCGKEDPVDCNEDALEIYLLTYLAAETIYESDLTGCNCLKLRNELEIYLAEAAKYPASCNIDISSELAQLNSLPCGPNTMYNDTFWTAWQCSITVPANYKHNSQLDSFRTDVELYYQNFPYVNPSYFNDNSYNKTTDKLQPGKQYNIVVYELLQDVHIEDCLQFMEKEGGLLTSIQGLTLAMMKQTTCIASGNINKEFHSIKIFSPDYGSTLPKDDGKTLLPVVENYFYDDGIQQAYFTWSCYLYDFADTRKKGQYLLVYYNE